MSNPNSLSSNNMFKGKSEQMLQSEYNDRKSTITEGNSPHNKSKNSNATNKKIKNLFQNVQKPNSNTDSNKNLNETLKMDNDE